MATTEFVNGVIIAPSWLNDVDALAYQKTFPDGKHPSVVETLATPTGGAPTLGFQQGAVSAAARTVSGVLAERYSVYDGGVVGDGVVDDTVTFALALSNADALGMECYIPSKCKILISSNITLPRWMVLTGESTRNDAVASKAHSCIVSTNGSGLILSSNNRLRGLLIDGTSAVAGSVGIQIGGATAFTQYTTLDQVTVRAFASCIKILNAYAVEMRGVVLREGTKGLNIAPPTFTGDGGYVNAVTMSQLYVHDMTEEGILNQAVVTCKVWNLDNVVVESCGNVAGGLPQINMGGLVQGLVANIYVETGALITPKPIGVKATRGRWSGYINGASTGFDAGTGTAVVDLDNMQFVNTTTSFTASGGSNAILNFNRCSFDTAPSISAASEIYTNCTGAVPTNVDTQGITIRGTNPTFQIGTGATSKIRSITYYTVTENVVVGANSTANGATVTTSTGEMSNSIVWATPTSGTPVGVVYMTRRIDDSNFSIRYVNATATPQTVTNTFICAVVKFK